MSEGMFEDLKPEEAGSLTKLEKDLRKALSMEPGKREARYIVETYYDLQKPRVAANNRLFAAQEAGEPAIYLESQLRIYEMMERMTKNYMGRFASQYRVGQWLQSICGIGPVLSAGLLVLFDVRKAPTAGQYWRFSGLDPGVEWLGKEKAAALVEEVLGKMKKVTEEHLQEIAKLVNRRAENLMNLMNKQPKPGLTRANLKSVLARPPWNQMARVLCAGKVGDSFVKFQNNPKDTYGKVYASRREWEEKRNDGGLLRSEAERALAGKKFRDTTKAKQFYVEGKLPPDHMFRRSVRYAVKLFLSHFHAVSFEDYHGRSAPVPYVFKDLGSTHQHLILPPNWPGDYNGKSLRELYES